MKKLDKEIHTAFQKIVDLIDARASIEDFKLNYRFHFISVKIDNKFTLFWGDKTSK